MLVTKIPLSSFEKAKYNNGLIEEIYPFEIADGKIRIDCEWWKLLGGVERNNIDWWGECHKLEIELCPNITRKEKFSDLEFSLYASWHSSFDYEQWFTEDISNGPKGVVMIPISPVHKKILKIITNRRSLTFSTLSARDIADLREFSDCITRRISPSKQYMLRLSSTSAKHDFDIHPVKGASEIIDQLTKSKRFLVREFSDHTKETFVVCVEWNPKITRRSEFRLFMFNRKIVAASQQYWYQNHSYTDDELNLVLSLVVNPPFATEVVYNSCVFDTYIDFENKSIHLIECNPYYSSGSALFNYISDIKVLSGKSIPELRILFEDYPNERNDR
jgi:hypothetical protein